MTQQTPISRRRALAITAVAGGFGLTAMLQHARLSAQPAAALTPVTWRSVALGANTSITLYHPDQARARQLIGRVSDEIARLENVFSLYRENSALTILNRDGVLAAPPIDLVRLLSEARVYSEATGGAFDITVQPLWDLYAHHFRNRTTVATGPSRQEISRALDRVDYQAVAVETGRIAFEKPGMAITLNGIAQGYITDRVADLLRAEGMDEVLIDIGEIRALGKHPTGRPWNVGISDPSNPERTIETLRLADRALATSAGAGTSFEPTGRHHHLFDPRSGQSASLYASVSVIAPRATTADALSTAFTNMNEEALTVARARFRDITGVLLRHDGTATSLA